jgi:hypothetical protein
MSALLRIEPPTDPQLAMIGRLCAEQGQTPPGAVYSKAEGRDAPAEVGAARTRAAALPAHGREPETVAGDHRARRSARAVSVSTRRATAE